MGKNGLVGETLGGRYRIEDLLGQGGMSAVYRAYDPNLKRVVAVKVIHSHLANDTRFLGRFESEATAVASLRHPNIVQVYDFSHDGNVYYMVQEFVPGETLHDQLQRLTASGRAMPIADAVRYTIDVTEAAAYAHKRGMIHRDIKPANIILDVHGKAILMDFGIVKMTGSVEHTVTGAVVGTAIYMPPELIRGEVADPRSDIYSLGVTLYEMISGRPPFAADSAMTLLMMHLQEPVPNLQDLRPGVPAPLVAIVQRALAKNREERFPSIADMGQALRDFQQGRQSAVVVHELPTEVNPSPVDDEPAGTERPGSLDQPTKRETPPSQGMPVWASGAHDQPTMRETPLEPGPRGTPGSLDQHAMRETPQTPVSGPRSGVHDQQTMRETPAGPVSSQRSGVHDRATLPETRRQPPPPLSFQGQANPPATPLPGEDGWSAGLSLPARRQGRRARPVLWIGGAVLLLVVMAGLAVLLLSRVGGEDTDGNLDEPAGELAGGVEPGGGGVPRGGGQEVAPPASEGGALAGANATIDNVTVDAEGRYAVDFQTTGLLEDMSAGHVHFFFDTLTPDRAGPPTEGAWLRHVGTSPFTGFATADRPENAGELCVVVANPDHQPQAGTGGCAPLPNVATVSSAEPVACRFGPGEDYPAVADLAPGEVTLVRGFSPDELWWNVVNPRNKDDVCWLPTLGTKANGDISTLLIIEPPPPGAVPDNQPAVTISDIELDAEGRYEVDFSVKSFEPAYPGTHIHFFFNTFSPDQVGIGGEANRRPYGGASPFVGYTPAERPAGATELCSLVAHPDHTMIADSGNCFPLPPPPSVEITGINVDVQSRYVVDFNVESFEPAYPGTHIHFFFNTFSPDQVGIGGEANRRPYGEAPPFVGYTPADRPAGATELCALVARPDHTMFLESGNCFPLPDALAVVVVEVELDASGRYIAKFVPFGFTPREAGTRVQFYFDNVSPVAAGEQATGGQVIHAGPSPFAGYTPADRPAEATALCAIVVLPNGSLLQGSGNCSRLPDAQ